MPPQIHWQEGLFLRPHHLQRMQKGFNDLVAAERRLAWPYPYGVIEARLSRDELENMRIRFERLRVIMPSGIEVSFPDSAELPSLDIKQAFAKGSFNVLLGVPLWHSSRANTVEPGKHGDGRAKLIYQVGEIECPDENTGDNAQSIQVRKVNARLLFEQDDTAELEVIPLLRVVRAAGEDVGLPKEHPEFVPPCLVLTGSALLRELVRDLVSSVEASRRELVVQLTRGGFSLENLRGLQFEQILRLRTLNRFSARLPSIVLLPDITPFEMYLELRELLAELAAMHPDRDEFDCLAYDHDSPYLCFSDLASKIRGLLRGAVAPSYLKVPFANDAQGVLSATLTDAQLSQPNAYFLAIKSSIDPTALAAYVEDGDRFKLMPRSLVIRAIRGVELKEERHAPLELPAASDLHYFRLNRAASERMWQQVQMEKTLGLRWTGNEIDWTGATFTLYMTVPGGTT